MHSVDPNSLNKKKNYGLLTATVAPRPVAFVSTMSKEEVLNAAPFSYFNVISAEPPLISISCGRRGSESKDTARNILERGEFVVHVTDESNVEAVNETAANLGPDESEVEKVGLTPVESEKIKVPGLKEAAVRFECKLEKHLTFSEGETTTDFIIGRIVQYHFADEVYKDGKVDTAALKPVGRLGGLDYTTLGDIFALDRPK
ncbi:flavin reductase family protein [Bacillus shivajii]|uniref:flavin reductase family protein n=1 Tax=Bacillus shivajii TaxID=1983719 RepID=UPI001CF9C94A|nr:flavin reductase family protein [Bacillus shivajii]UCZ53993.1 flavin reductase family protein [Bacillus shivajii]